MAICPVIYEECEDCDYYNGCLNHDCEFYQDYKDQDKEDKNRDDAS